MCHGELPRVCELICLIEDQSAPSAYFQDFENSVRNDPEKKQVWLAREAELSKLDENAWDYLKNEARPYLTKRDPKRGWAQLISILNQARAYGYLQSIGCSTPRFIPSDSKKTPDLEADLNGGKVLCEVKTIGPSDEEVTARCNNTVRTTKDCLETGFCKKLSSTLEQAKNQMEAYDGGGSARQIVFAIINFNDLWAQYKENYYRQVDDYLGKNPVPGIEIVFFNQRTPFHAQVRMSHATVVNE
ncbi:MAG: hypothetical protein ACREBW_08310 [Candidatus Micrarchaeaceae archaeon]